MTLARFLTRWLSFAPASPAPGLVAVVLSCLWILTPMAGPARGDERVITDDRGRIVAVPLPVEARFQNPWPIEWEDAFRTRADHAVRAVGRKGPSGNTYFENEKNLYPTAMMAFLSGNRQGALSRLQEEDNQAASWNSLTKGIDFYACFTLKGQMRKYFFFGQYLDPAYKQRMFDGAGLWTERDPLRRPNPFHKGQKEGWTPETMNSWVDVRSTDNLRAMRETSVYLMAEETGNQEVRLQYKRAIQRYVWALYHIGMGEWDSENYHSHTITPYINLYDFARDPEVKLAAKAALDWLSAAGAVKYYHGGFCGPIKRDYHKPYVFGGAAADLWLWFDATPHPPAEPDRDGLYYITSSYRPPAAVAALGRKEDLPGPVEILASKPTYETWRVEGNGAGGGRDYPQPRFWDADHAPEYFETTYIGRTFQLGTLPTGSMGDVNGFKMIARNDRRGADFIVAASGNGQSDPGRISTASAGGDAVAHYENQVIFLNANRGGGTVVQLMLPGSAAVEGGGSGPVFVRLQDTWLAVHPLNAQFRADDPALTQALNKKKTNADDRIATLTAAGPGPMGFVMEVGEGPTDGPFEKFLAAVKTRARLDASGLAAGRVSYVAATTGRSVGIDTTSPSPGGGVGHTVYRNSRAHNFKAEHWPLYQSRYVSAKSDGSFGDGPIHLGWKKGALTVTAAGHRFTAAFTHDGRYTFENSTVK